MGMIACGVALGAALAVDGLGGRAPRSHGEQGGELTSGGGAERSDALRVDVVCRGVGAEEGHGVPGFLPGVGKRMGVCVVVDGKAEIALCGQILGEFAEFGFVA